MFMQAMEENKTENEISYSYVQTLTDVKNYTVIKVGNFLG